MAAPSARAPSSSWRLKFDGNVSIGQVSFPPSARSSRSVGLMSLTPGLAEGEVAQEILERYQRLSKPFGTRVEIEGNVGYVRL